MPASKTNESANDTAHALVAFVDAAHVYARACFLEDTKLQRKACADMRGAAIRIEDLTGSRDIFLPLLEHSNPSVRLNACLSLIDDHFERVVPVLQDLDVNCVTEMSSSAGLALQMYGQPNTGNGFTYVEPSMKLYPGKKLKEFDIERQQKSAPTVAPE